MLVKELSALSGVNIHALNNYLRQRGQVPSVEAGVKIARALGVSAEFLVFGEDGETEQRTSSEIRVITRMTRQLEPGKLRFAINMMKLLTGSRILGFNVTCKPVKPEIHNLCGLHLQMRFSRFSSATFSHLF
jgi:transcriptional regulator with XRE-family HTH domain